MKEFYERKLKEKSDKELTFIRDNPHSMNPDAVAVAHQLLTERAERGEEVKQRHFGREILSEFKAREFKQSLRSYFNEYGYKTLLATIVPACIVLGLLHLGLKPRYTRTEAILYFGGIYSLGIPLGHYFYKRFHKKSNDLLSRFVHSTIYLASFIFMVFLEVKTISILADGTFTLSLNSPSLLLVFVVTLLLEILWSLINSVLKVFGIHLW